MPRPPKDEEATKNEVELKETKRACARLVVDNNEENLIIELNEKTELPVYLGREGKEFKEKGTFVNLKKYTEAKTISHLHAKILYDAKQRAYTFLSIGRNGTHVDGEAHLKEQGELVLCDRSVIQIGGFAMKIIYC
ncbi:hypothetical protein EIN_226250 [Entamoeba invadens IP1]|uniref:FHA domain-containing protein n=1 Tax=Entamoeba invadens IP1 TaxID=370355 RepID=A0A0A1U2H2_ENTIV|nr:hypothetical protein EIN_226250 [Entamoeba invadens IP1]ELP88262.1 hypothetical protein EIN_226250 [Entamoeba invadens IP1]|eukprot:XP_004255033.1 hypothetical protein EIN_226250 [Entamoeba invadens IP1]